MAKKGKSPAFAGDFGKNRAWDGKLLFARDDKNLVILNKLDARNNNLSKRCV